MPRDLLWRVVRWWRTLGSALGLTLAAPLLAGWQLAFDEGAVAYDQCVQRRNGVVSPADPRIVRQVLGFESPDPRTGIASWTGGDASLGEETIFDYLVVLKEAVSVGTVCVDPADETPKGSVNNGEVWCLPEQAGWPPDPDHEASWHKIAFPPYQPLCRFATLPPGFRSRAFLYRDRRVRGTSRVDHWRFFRTPLANLTPTARPMGSGGFKAKDPENVIRGEPWEVPEGEGGTPIGSEHPAWFILAWDQPHTVSAIFLRSNASRFEFQGLQKPAQDAAELALESAWRPLATQEVRECRHEYGSWACAWRWISVLPTALQAIRLNVHAVDKGGSSLWINGWGVFTENAEPSETIGGVDRDDLPPFRLALRIPTNGLMALGLDDERGRRIRNLVAQAERLAGEATEAWDLKDDRGQYVAPGLYRLRGVVGPPVQLVYRLTPYPNVDQLWPDRTPWMQGHSAPHGWLSDHCPNFAIATRADRVYFGASMAEAGVCFIECDLDGKKLWGKHDFGAWLGVYMMAADEEAVYVAATDRTLYRWNPNRRETQKLFRWGGDPKRQGRLCGLAAGAGRLYLGFTGRETLDSGLQPDLVDLDNSIPRPRSDDFLRALRLKGNPPGQNVNPRESRPQGNGRLDLESTWGPEPRQHLVVAFREPVPLGSLVFPCPTGSVRVTLSVLKPQAPFPPRPTEEDDWQPFEVQPRPGWTCLPAPPGVVTRALRVSFLRSELQPRDEVADLLADAVATPETKAREGPWFGRLEGLRFLRRRFVDVAPEATVRVNSGVVGADGIWDAQRTMPLARETPGIYVLQWPRPQKLSGLAIREIEGAVTDIDIWQGPVDGEVPLEGPAGDPRSVQNGWRQVATYRQKRRSAYHPSPDCNKFARYLDGCVDFRGEVATRAVRLRIVEPWYDHGEKNAECRRHDGRPEHGLHYTQSYAAQLDTRLCRVEGVAALCYVGGELPIDPLTYQRLEVRDGRSGELQKEFPLHLGWHGLACGPGGTLFAIDASHQNVVQIDVATGHMRVVVPDCQPDYLAVGPDGCLYVHPWTQQGTEPIRVYNPGGGLLRTVGQPGGHRAGAWNPECLEKVGGIAVDRTGQLWVLETGDYPRRIIQFRADGTLVKELLGNRFYGGTGGGALDRYDPRRAWYGPVEFDLDWSESRSRIAALLSRSLHAPDLVARRVSGRTETYLVSMPHALHARQPFGIVYRYDPQTHTVRPAAAMGDGERFLPLRSSTVISRLEGAVPKEFRFVWSDLDGNGQVDPDEVRFDRKTDPRSSAAVGPFDFELGCTGADGVYYRVQRFLPNGAPLYEGQPAPVGALLRLQNGNFFTLSGPGEDGPANRVTSPSGEILWSYPAHAGVSGLSIPPWQPGRVTHQFGIIGHEVAPQGDLGEFVVIHANTGEWNLWTADGLLAGQILLHKMNPVARLLGPPEAKPGMRLDPLSAGQEHFHGFFTMTEPDSRYFIIAGFTHMSLIEVQGLDRFRRVEVPVRVTTEHLAQTRAWEARRVRRQIESRALVLRARRVRVSPTLDGRRDAGEWPEGVALDASDSATFSIAYDDRHLYLCWRARGLGPLRNSGSEFQRLFKTGAALDFYLGVDPKAPAQRTQPAAGDLRLLVASVSGRLEAVLFQPVAPGAAPEERWVTRTEAGGETAFDRVVRLPGVSVAMSGERDFTVEASVPLDALGLSIHPGLVLPMDWGILSSSDGHQVQRRLYWANKTATGTSDEAVEARLEPHLWGRLLFEDEAARFLEEKAP